MLRICVCLLIGGVTTVATANTRPVDRYPFVFETIPGGPSTGGPYVGNGDIGVVLSSIKSKAKDGFDLGTLVYSLGKNDFWVSEGKTYFSHLAAPTLTVSLGNGSYGSNVTQNIGEATLSAVMKLKDNSTVFTADTIATEGNTSTVLTSIVCTRTDGADCDVTLSLRGCCGTTDLITQVGGSDDGIWLRKENLHVSTNEAYTGSCDPNVLLYNLERRFVVAPTTGVLTMQNGSCPWVLEPENATASPITTGDCSSAQGQWLLRAGEVVWKGGATELCLSGEVTLGPCGNSSTQWVLNNSTGRTAGYLSAGGDFTKPSCLLIVPDNTNNTLGSATTVIDSTTNTVVKGKTSGAAVNATNPSDGAVYTVALTSGKKYTIVTTVVTLRDVGCAGTRSDTEMCSQSIENEATQLAAKFVGPTAITEAHTQQAMFWSAFWNASAIDITQGSNSSVSPIATTKAVFERWYYGMQYSFGSNSRQGKVAPSLQGVLTVMEPVDWNDQLTIDYNFESNYWGAGSSNHLEMMKPYVATVTNPAVLETMRQRATNPGVWDNAEDTHWPGTVGSTIGSTACNSLNNSGTCGPDLSHGKGYRGAAWPSTMFPLGDGRPAPTDLSTRFVGGLVATPLIQYFEYSRDLQMLKDVIYPVVRDNAEFYASFAIDDGSGPITFPYTCAQEACACRDGTSWYWRWGEFVKIPLPNMTQETLLFSKNNDSGIFNTKLGEHNAHTDVAFASASFRKAAEYAKLLNVDADLQANWLALLARMPKYPTQTLTFVKNDSAIVVGSELSGKPLLVEAMAGATPEQAAAYVRGDNGSCSHPPCSTIVWPWCNVEYPISNFAGMWPTDEIGTLQTGATDPTLLAAAKTTVFGLCNYTGYTFKGTKTPFANQNGFGLSWPAAVRVSNTSDSVWLITQFSIAAGLVAHNGIMHTGGGMLENMGAVIAANDMLFQSHAGALRFFPVWDAKVLGSASFTTLRGYGAFVVSTSIDETGTVGDIDVLSEQGGECVVDSPWLTGLVVTHDGAKVATTQKGSLYTFSTTAGAEYILSKP
eukprot:m.217461 g.217461  ORF g.217461 m.217461 type:complete len:1044 (-) comp33236_c0_seq11:690-3821(-)